MAVISGYVYAALILPAYYLADSTITVLSRLMQGKRIWEPHHEFYYQKALKNGRKPETIVRLVASVNMLLIFLARRTVIEPDLSIFYLALAYLSVFMLLGFFAHSHAKQSDEPP